MTRFPCAAPWLQRGEIALRVIGLSLVAYVIAVTMKTEVYQARQERAFSLSPSSDVTRDPATRAGGDPLVLGRIEIPRIGVEAFVREGDDDTTLAIAVGHIPGTARPGERGNMALAGHRDSFFRPLREIRLQDRIRIVTPKWSYEYAVDSTEVVDPEDTRALDPTNATILSLVTCYPFNYVGPAPNRFIVRASLVAPPPEAARGGEVARPSGDLRFAERARP